MSRRVLKFNFCAFHHVYYELLKNKIENSPSNIRTIFVDDIFPATYFISIVIFILVSTEIDSLYVSFKYDIIGYIYFNHVYSKQKQKCSMAKFEFIYVEIKIGMQHTYKQSHNVKENFF